MPVSLLECVSDIINLQIINTRLRILRNVKISFQKSETYNEKNTIQLFDLSQVINLQMFFNPIDLVWQMT